MRGGHRFGPHVQRDLGEDRLLVGLVAALYFAAMLEEMQFFQVADNLASCWLVREHMNDDFLLINGDTLFEGDESFSLVLTAVSNATPTSITGNGFATLRRASARRL